MPDLFAGVNDAPVDLNGALIYPNWLTRRRQASMTSDIRDVAGAAPFRRYKTASGRQMSVQMTAAGDVGWMTDRSGYRYAPRHSDGGEWPKIPASILAVWREISGVDRDPDSCLINYYGEGARMGLHQDKDEADLSWPVVSVSLGDAALFRVGGLSRKDPTRSRWLSSGDVVALTGDARLAHHGIDRIRFASSELLPEGGRINITLRVAR